MSISINWLLKFRGKELMMLKIKEWVLKYEECEWLIFIGCIFCDEFGLHSLLTYLWKQLPYIDLPFDLTILLVSSYPREKKTTSAKDLYHKTFNHNSNKRIKTRDNPHVHQQENEEHTAVYLYNGTQFSNKEEQRTDVSNNMNQSHRYNTELKESHSK